jgi:hypothetical protein
MMIEAAAHVTRVEDQSSMPMAASELKIRGVISYC